MINYRLDQKSTENSKVENRGGEEASKIKVVVVAQSFHHLGWAKLC